MRDDPIEKMLTGARNQAQFLSNASAENRKRAEDAEQQLAEVKAANKALATEIERLRAKLAKAEDARDAAFAVMDSAIASDEASKKRLASAKEVIEPFAGIGRNTSNGRRWINGAGYDYLCDWFEPILLRAAAEWMEKGDE